MAADFVYDSEALPPVITHWKVRRSRCVCLLFLFLIATFVGLAPIMVYRSLGVPLPEGLKGYRNVQPWVILSQLNPVDESRTPPAGPNAQESTQQSFQTSATPSASNSHLRPSQSTQLSVTTSSDLPTHDTPILMVPA